MLEVNSIHGIVPYWKFIVIPIILQSYNGILVLGCIRLVVNFLSFRPHYVLFYTHGSVVEGGGITVEGHACLAHCTVYSAVSSLRVSILHINFTEALRRVIQLPMSMIRTDLFMVKIPLLMLRNDTFNEIIQTFKCIFVATVTQFSKSYHNKQNFQYFIMAILNKFLCEA